MALTKILFFLPVIVIEIVIRTCLLYEGTASILHDHNAGQVKETWPESTLLDEFKRRFSAIYRHWYTESA